MTKEQLGLLLIMAIIMASSMFAATKYYGGFKKYVDDWRKKRALKKESGTIFKPVLVGILFLSPIIILALVLFSIDSFIRNFQKLLGTITGILPNIPSWIWVGLLITIVLVILWKIRRRITLPKLPKINWRPAVPKNAWGWVWKIGLTIILIGVLFYGIKFWKEPTLVTSFLKGIFQRKELGLDKWFGVNAGEKYRVIIGNNTLGVWPMIKGIDTVTVTVRNSEGTERYRIWNGSHYGRIGADRLTPSLDNTIGVFTFIFNKDVEVKLSTMPPK